MFYLFHGEDEFSRAEELARLRARLAREDPGMADLNTTILDGKGLTFGELRHVCDAVPFMASRRLVIVHGLLSHLSARQEAEGQETAGSAGPGWKRAYLQDLADYLPNLPPTTRLVLVEEKSLPPSHPILKLARPECVKEFQRPREKDLPAWIERRAKASGGNLSSEAVTLLAALVGNDLRLLDQEIEKLLLYAEGRQVTSQDVQTLVSLARQASIFELVDCVGRRQTDRALHLLHRLLDEGEAPLYLLTMLARQVRILIQVSELRSQGVPPAQVAGRLKLHAYVAEKALAQAQNFRLAQLEAAHQRLVETDWAIKTGKCDEVLALDLLIVGLT